MNMNDLRRLLDLPQVDIDPKVFADALVIEHVRTLIRSGGGRVGQPYLASALRPQQLEVFLACAVEATQKTGRLEHEWCALQQEFPDMKAAWQRGQALFQEDLVCAMGNTIDMRILSQDYLAVDIYAFVSTFALYFDNPALQNWAINGYMVAWRQHFSE